jgi:predicted MPP superfamily phosphohydrolase
VRERELAAGLDLLRRARPDLVAMTGDLIDYDPRYVPLLGRFAREISGLRPRFGVFAVPGNHDYYTDVDAVLAALRGADVTVLRNDARAIEGRLALLGTDDCWAERDNWGARYDLGAALAAAPRDLPRILLCHNPERFAEAAPHVDLQISGHTHGGQVQLVVRPADIFLRHGFVEGHYELGASQLYVNRGFGTAGPPARLYTPPEVTKLVLVRA